MPPDVGPPQPARKRAPRARKAKVSAPAAATGEALLGVTDAQLADLKLSREVAWYMVSRGYRLPEEWQVPRWKTPEPGELDRAAVFDPTRVDRVVNAFKHLRHTKGAYAGRALMPDTWQIAWIIAPVFGWVRRDVDYDLEDRRA